MNNSTIESKDQLSSSENPPTAYQSEYLSIHDQRRSLHQTIHLWHQIGWPSSLLIFGFLFHLGKTDKDLFLIWFAFCSASFLVWFVRIYSMWSLDKRIIHLYPRIIALELILKYHFYRNILGNLDGKVKEYIDQCEKIKATTPDEIWEELKRISPPGNFRRWKRGHGFLNCVALIMTACFLFLTRYATCSH